MSTEHESTGHGDHPVDAFGSSGSSPPPRKILLPHDGPYAYTDAGNAERLVARFGQESVYVHKLNTWYVFDPDPGRWTEDSGSLVMMARALHTARALSWSFDPNDTTEEAKQARSWALRSEAAERLKAAVSLTAAIPGMAIGPDQLDADPFLLAVANGVIDLRTGELRKGRPEDFITKSSPVTYTPGLHDPRWDDFLHRATGGDRDFQLYLQKAAGYTLTGSTEEEKLFITHGPKWSGKSTFNDALTTALGNYATATQPATFAANRFQGDPYELARLRGARLVTTTEVGRGQRLSAALIKQVTGGDKVKARQIRQAGFEYRPTWKLWIATNHAPEIDVDSGVQRRVIKLPFAHTFESPDRSVKRWLNTPDGGAVVLAWAVEGAQRWAAEGLGEPPTVVDLDTAAYLAEEDQVGRFLEVVCERQPNGYARFGSLYDNYRAWCERNGEDPLTSKQFGNVLRDEHRIPAGQSPGANSAAIRKGIVLARPLLPVTPLERGI